MASVLDAAHFHDETAAYEHVESLLWPTGPVCPHCGNCTADKIGRLNGKTSRPGLRKCYECLKTFTVKMGSIFEDSGDELLGLGSCLSGPLDDTGRGPLQVFLMSFGPVLGQGGESSRVITSGVTGHPAVFEEDFDGGGGESHLDLLFNQLTRDAVVMAIDLHMIVDIDPSLFPFGKLIGRIGERFQGGLVQGFEEGPAGGRGLEFPMV